MIINSLIKIHNRAQLIKAFLNNRYFFGYCIALCPQGNAANHLSFVEFDGNVLSMYPSLKFTALCCIVNFFCYNPSRFCAFLAKTALKKQYMLLKFFQLVSFKSTLPTAFAHLYIHCEKGPKRVHPT